MKAIRFFYSNTIFLLIIAVAFIGNISFSQQKIKKETVKQTEKRLSKLFADIPGGTIIIDGVETAIAPFQMEIRTVTNFDYKEFIYFLKNNNRLEEYHAYYPDSTVFGPQYLSFGATYFKQRNFDKYPVVGITIKAAMAYAEWLGEQNKVISEAKNLTFRLPLKSEWIYAASHGNSQNQYAWEGNHTRSATGQLLANFMTVSNATISKGENGKPIVLTQEKATFKTDNELQITTFTSPSKSYTPNYWGLYNMNGNVAEMLYDKKEVIGGSWQDYGYDIRNSSVQPYNGEAKSTVGFRLVRVKELTYR